MIIHIKKEDGFYKATKKTLLGVKLVHVETDKARLEEVIWAKYPKASLHYE